MHVPAEYNYPKLDSEMILYAVLIRLFIQQTRIYDKDIVLYDNGVVNIDLNSNTVSVINSNKKEFKFDIEDVGSYIPLIKLSRFEICHTWHISICERWISNTFVVL